MTKYEDDRGQWYAQTTDDEREDFRRWLGSCLCMHELNVEFTKKDGSNRKMRCTLREDVLPKLNDAAQGEPKDNINTVTVFDLDKSEWRSFRYDSIKQLNFTIGE
jgi:hypothetical protein